MLFITAGKAVFKKGCWNPKRKLGVTTLFKEIIKQQQFEREVNPVIFVWIPKTLAKISFSRIAINRAKNNFVLEGTVLKKPDRPEMCRTYAYAKRGTVLDGCLFPCKRLQDSQTISITYLS